MSFQILLAIVAVIAGGIASLAGFGIGSMLTPLLTLKISIGIAVAGVSIAHLFGTSLRFISLRKQINKRILLSFGLTSAAGGLIGALLHNIIQNVLLTTILGGLLVFAGLMGITGLADRFRLKGIAAWIAGGTSGMFGGLVGNQGSIRSAAMLGFNLKQEEFVATATGTALMVDTARVPVYLAVYWNDIISIWHYVLIATAGVIAGTVAGRWVLRRLPENVFKKTIAVIILLVGVLVLINR